MPGRLSHRHLFRHARRAALGPLLCAPATALLASTVTVEVGLFVEHEVLTRETPSIVVATSNGERSVRLRGEGRHAVDLDGLDLADSVLTCRGDGVWCPEITLAPDAEPPFLPVLGAATVAGQVVVRDGSPPPRLTAQGWVRLAPSFDPIAGFESETEVAADGTFRFAAPAGLLDVRLAAPGFAAVYLWNVSEPETAMRTVRLTPGSSVSGFVFDLVNDLPAADAEVVLSPLEQAETEADRARRHQLASRTTSNRQGFFQIQGIEPGVYRLDAIKEGRAPAAVEAVTIERGAETVLEQAIGLDRPLSLHVEVQPPRAAGRSPLDDPARPAAPAARRPGIPRSPSRRGRSRDADRPRPGPGDDRGLGRVVSARPRKGARGARRPDRPPGRRPGAHPRRVSLNDEPIAARIEVSTSQADRTTLRSEPEEGRFDGWLRRPERKVLLVRVQADTPRLDRELVVRDPETRDDAVFLDLALRGQDLHGVVVDPAGQPVSGARVRVGRDTRTLVRDRSADGGAFTLASVPPGDHDVYASHREKGDAEPLTITVDPDRAAASIRLVLGPRKRIRGTLIGAHGHPVAHADIAIHGLGGRPAAARRLQTGFDGSFEAEVGAGSSHALVKVSAPSFDLWSGCLRLDDAPMRLTLPPKAPASLHIGLRADDSGLPVTAGWLALITSDGGVLNAADLLRWHGQNALASPRAASAEGEVWQVSGLRPGLRYLPIWTHRSAWDLMHAACGMGVLPAGEWVDLVTGQVASATVQLGQTPADVNPRRDR